MKDKVTTFKLRHNFDQSASVKYHVYQNDIVTPTAINKDRLLGLQHTTKSALHCLKRFGFALMHHQM